MIITKKFTMALDQRGVAPVIDAVQDDSFARAVAITLTNEGQPWEIPSDTTAAIRFKKRDGKSGLYDTLPDGSAAYSIADNVVTVTLAPEVLTAEGNVAASVALYNGTNILGVFPFIVSVAPNPAGGQSISNNYYYLQTWDDVNAAIGQLSELSTTDKTSLVAAINELAEKAVMLPEGGTAGQVLALGEDGSLVWADAGAGAYANAEEVAF